MRVSSLCCNLQASVSVVANAYLGCARYNPRLVCKSVEICVWISQVDVTHAFVEEIGVVLVVVEMIPETTKAEVNMFGRLAIQDIQIFKIFLKCCLDCKRLQQDMRMYESQVYEIPKIYPFQHNDVYFIKTIKSSL